MESLEQHGLDRCPDHGIDGFKRYVALAVLARNVQRLGALYEGAGGAECEASARTLPKSGLTRALKRHRQPGRPERPCPNIDFHTPQTSQSRCQRD